MKCNKLVTVLSLVNLVFLTAFSQSQTYIGLEFAKANDQMVFFDDGQSISSGPLFTHFYGVSLLRELGENIAISTGIQKKEYWSGFKHQTEQTAITSSSASYEFSAFQFPVRLTGSYNIFKDKLFFQTTLGYHFCINNQGEHESYSTSKLVVNNDSVMISTIYTSGLEKYFSLIEAGIGFNYKFNNDAKIYISGSYFNGFKKLSELEIKYSKNNEPQKNAYGIGSGDYFALKIGFLYPLKLKHK